MRFSSTLTLFTMLAACCATFIYAHQLLSSSRAKR